MICDVDVGNSRIKWRFSDSSQVMQATQAADLVRECVDRQVDRIRLSAVAPIERYGNLAEQLERVACTPEVAVVKSRFGGVRIAYRNPGSLGVDRWLAMLAARARESGDLVVVSLGTAATVDFLAASGVHLGGLIVPGMDTSAKALYASTDGVGAERVNLPERWQLGDATLNCVENGLSALYGGFFEQVYERANELLDNPKIMITGGGAPIGRALFGDFLGVSVQSTLVLDGLAVAIP